MKGTGGNTFVESIWKNGKLDTTKTDSKADLIIISRKITMLLDVLKVFGKLPNVIKPKAIRKNLKLATPFY